MTIPGMKPYGLKPPKTLIYPTYTPMMRNVRTTAKPITDIRPVIRFRGNYDLDGMCSYCGEAASSMVVAGCLDAHIDEIELCQRCVYARWENPTRSVYFSCPELGCLLVIDQWNILKGKLYLCVEPRAHSLLRDNALYLPGM